MRKRIAYAAVAAVLVLAALGVWAARSATPVSAKEILSRAAATQDSAAESQGIHHTRTESYTNGEVVSSLKGASVPEIKTITESYVDPATSRYRSVQVDAATGRVQNVTAFDGTYLYSSEGSQRSPDGGPLSVLRSPVPQGALEVPELWPDRMPIDDKNVFESMRQDPNVKFAGRETWSGGLTVYVLRSETAVPVRGVKDRTPNNPDATALATTLFIDTRTYRLLETRQTMQRDGKEVIVSYRRTLTDEILPETAEVAWDLGDLQAVPGGVVIAAAPEGSTIIELPVPISQQELASRTQSAYMLKTTPEGFQMQIVALARPHPDEPDAYTIYYRGESGDVFSIQGGMSMPDSELKRAGEVVRTTSGLTVYFEPSADDARARFITYGAVVAPDGTSFVISSTLARDHVKALIEQLVPVR